MITCKARAARRSACGDFFFPEFDEVLVCQHRAVGRVWRQGWEFSELGGVQGFDGFNRRVVDVTGAAGVAEDKDGT